MIVDAERDTVEANFIRKLSALTEKQRKRVLDVLGYPPDINNLTPDIWQGMDAEYRALFEPILEDIYILSADNQNAAFNNPADSGRYTEAGQEWAGLFTVTLTGWLITNRQKNIRQIVERHNDNSESTQSELRARIGRWYSSDRVESISVTETTRSAHFGGEQVITQLRAEGFRFRERWYTVRDGRVCMRCEPLNGTYRYEAWIDPPPIHDKDRCWVAYEIDEREQIA